MPEASQSDFPAEMRLILDRLAKHSGEDAVLGGAVEQGVGAILGSEAAVDAVCAILFPDGPPVDVCFYDKLTETVSLLGFTHGQKLIGVVWSKSFERLGTDRGTELLRTFLQTGHSAFFPTLYGLPVLLGVIELPVDFLSEWLCGLRGKLGNDGASEGFWKSLAVLSEAFPLAATEVARRLTVGAMSDDAMGVAAALLGGVRGCIETLESGGTFDRLDAALAQHPDVRHRMVHHSSWIYTARRRKLTTGEFESRLHVMSEGSPEEEDEIFNLLRDLLRSPALDDESIRTAVSWLRQHARPGLSVRAQYCAIDSVEILQNSPLLAGDPPLWNIAVAVLPIPEARQGVWRALEHLLVQSLHKDLSAFEAFLMALLAADPKGLFGKFHAPRSFEYLLSQLQLRDLSGLVSRLLFSRRTSERALGFFLFDRLPNSTLPADTLENRSDVELAVSLLTFRVELVHSATVPRFLLAVLPRMEKGSDDLKALYREELLHQAKCYPAGCLDVLKTRIADSVMIAEAVEETQRYFDALHACRGTAINSIGIPGLERATRVKAQRDHREIHRRSEELSVFAQFMATSYLLYGGKDYRYFRDGHLGETMALGEISSQMELPRLTMIDPDGDAQRKFHARMLMQRLLTRVVAEEDT